MVAVVKKALVLVLFVLLCSSSPVYGFLNTTGSTGLLLIPSTELHPQGSFTINYYNVGLVGSRININYGITPFLELGLHLRIDEGEQQVGPSIKGVLPVDETDELELAIGLAGSSLYAVAGGDLDDQGLRGYLGYGSGDLNGLFGGVSKTIDPIQLLGGDYVFPSRFVLEYMNKGINLGLQLTWSDEVAMSIGVKDMLGEENVLVIGLQFSTYF